VIITYIYSTYPDDQIRVQIRCRNLVDAINRTGLHSANLLDMNSFIQNTADVQKICLGSDLLVIYRYLYGPILNALQYWKARDKKVIVDFDQAFNYLTADKPGYSFWVEGVPLEDYAIRNKNLIDPIPLEQFKWGLRMVDAATVSSGRLVDDWSQFTNVHEVPDYINTYQYPALNQTHENEIWIGLVNSVNYDSFQKSGLLSAMKNVCKERPQVRLILCNLETGLDIDLDINPAQMKIYSPRFFEEWVSILLKLDIGLAPIYGDYDFRLSQSSLLEFMISKIPWVASEHLTFHELLQYGQWVQNTSDAWENAILTTVDQLNGYQKKAAKEPFLFAISQDVSANIDKTLKIYTSIISQA
jgi:glycosyltransferase involved in cell wall biosynthesis